MARLDELERKFEENPRRYFAPLANEYRKAGDAAKAAELCRAQLPEVPGHISGHIVLGQALFDSGDFAGARAALETALALDPENIVALRYLGDIARNTGDAAEAERWYSRTLEADPYNEAATLGLQALGEGDSAPVSEPASEAAAAEARPASSEAEPIPDAPLEGFEPTAHGEELVRTEVPGEPPAEEPVTYAAASEEPPSAVGDHDFAEIAISPAVAEDFASVATAPETEERSSEPVVAEVTEPPVEAVSAQEPALAEAEPATAEPESAGTLPESPPVEDVRLEEGAGAAEFAGDLAISAASEPADESNGELRPAEAQAESVERFDEAAHEPTEASVAADAPLAVPADEAMQAEERVMESAAPFVTETMADLYLEQGYPHEALELLLQLAEARPDDERLREKVAVIESVIAARRDAAVAAARAERAEAAQAADAAAQTQASDVAASGMPEAAVEEPAPSDAPFDAAVAEVDSSAFVESQDSGAPPAFEIPPFLPAEEQAPTTVRELFARMDRARPRPASSVTPRPLSRLRSDFVPMPDPGATASEPADDPFAFPDTPRPEQRVPRTSGPHPTFNPSTADIDDFEAWLRGLKGP